MDVILASAALLGNATHHGKANGTCVNTDYPWAYTYLGECVHNNKQLAALILGLSSILFWMVAQGPQIYKNWRKGSAEGLSGYFLLDWLCGDITNLVGCILTPQVKTQLYTAIWFCIIDCAMLSQFIYYTKIVTPRVITKPKVYVVSAVLLAATFYSVLPAADSVGVESLAVEEHSTGRVLLEIKSFQSTKTIIGYAIGCISGLMYCTSRIPQIIKNFKRKSCEGLSLAMFCMAILGNVTYALGVLLVSVDNDFMIDHLPWLVGSIGTLVFDFTIFFQFLCFGESKADSFDLDKEPGLRETDPLLQAV